VIITELFTYGTIITELSLAILIWNKTLRPWVLPFGVLLHLSIDFWVLVGFFSYAMFCGYIAFTPPETASRAILATRDQVKRIRGSAAIRRSQPAEVTS
jgi:hypothetical protein